jgi:hypothetical protein
MTESWPDDQWAAIAYGVSRQSIYRLMRLRDEKRVFLVPRSFQV